MSFEPLQPRNLGHFIDVQPHAEKRALDAVGTYIDQLNLKITKLESLRDSMGGIMVDLIGMLREYKPDVDTLRRLEELEQSLKDM